MQKVCCCHNAIGMLNTLLTDTMSLSEKIEIWDKKFDFDMLSDDEERRSKIYVYAVVDADSKNFNDKNHQRGSYIMQKIGHFDLLYECVSSDKDERGYEVYKIITKEGESNEE